MAAIRRRNVVATLMKLVWTGRRSASLSPGPGCTCESCVQAWDRHQVEDLSRPSETRRLRPGLY